MRHVRFWLLVSAATAACCLAEIPIASAGDFGGWSGHTFHFDYHGIDHDRGGGSSSGNGRSGSPNGTHQAPSRDNTAFSLNSDGNKFQIVSQGMV